MKLIISKFTAIISVILIAGCVDNIETCGKEIDSLIKENRLPSFFSKNQQGQCVSVDTSSAETSSYFINNNCTDSISFLKEAKANFCKREFDNATAVKYGSSEDAQPNAWTLGYSAAIRAATGSDKKGFNPEVPLLQRRNYRTTYRTITDPKTQKEKTIACNLEMRVYKKANNTDGTPLMLIHGGGWQQRLTTGHRAEALISRFTDEGFVVYMPFYRLVADNAKEAPIGCIAAELEQSKNDIREAFQWMENNNSLYTSSNKKFRIVGQSVGGLMSVMLAQENSDKVEKVAPMYAVPDFKHQLYELKTPNAYDGTYAQSMLSLLAGVDDWTKLTPSTPAITDNSLLEKINNNPSAFPKAFITHGMSDQIVSPSQSLRLCYALKGKLNDVANIEFNIWKNKSDVTYEDNVNIRKCGGLDNELRLLKNTRHHYDYNCKLDIESLNCRTTNKKGNSTKAAIKVLEDMTKWLK